MTKTKTHIMGWMAIAFTLMIPCCKAQNGIEISANIQNKNKGVVITPYHKMGKWELGADINYFKGDYKKSANFNNATKSKFGEMIPSLPISVINPDNEIFHGIARTAEHQYTSVGAGIHSNLTVLDYTTTLTPIKIGIINKLGMNQVWEDYRIDYWSERSLKSSTNKGSRKFTSLGFTSGIGVEYLFSKNMAVTGAASVTFFKPFLDVDHEVDLNSPYVGNEYSASIGIKYDILPKVKSYSCRKL